MLATGSLRNCRAAATVLDGRRQRAALELAVGIGVVFAVLWTDHRSVLSKPSRTALHLVAGLGFAGLLCARRPSLSECGLRPDSWSAGLPELAAATMLGALGLAGLGMFWPAAHGDPDFRLVRWLMRNAHVDLFQQVLLHLFLMARLNEILVSDVNSLSDQSQRDPIAGSAVPATSAALFALLHTPNLPLMLATALAGFYWTTWFRRYRNLPAATLSHIALAAAAISFVGMSDLRVGIGYVMRRSL